LIAGLVSGRHFAVCAGSVKIQRPETSKSFHRMLAALNITALGLGIGAGGLAATVAALLVSIALNLLGFESGVDIGLAAGVGLGLLVGGWVAGTFARHSGRFHGAVTGLLLAALIVVIARMGGSAADTLSVVWLFVLAGFLGGTSGWLAGRRKPSRS
jgi:hypothetical protein